MFTRESAQLWAARFIVNHPKLAMFYILVANSFLLSAAAEEFTLRKKNDSAPCTKRHDSFAGFGNLETKQCDPIIEVLNSTLAVVGICYFELTKIKNIGGSATRAQVPLQNLEKQLTPIINTIIGMAQFANPPLDPFPVNYQGQCEITLVPSVDYVTTKNKRTGGTSTSVIKPERYIHFIFQNLNPALCNLITDYIHDQEKNAEDNQEVIRLDAGKAFVVIAMIIAVAIGLVGLYGLCIGFCRCVSSPRDNSENRFFQPQINNFSLTERSIPQHAIALDPDPNPQQESKC